MLSRAFWSVNRGSSAFDAIAAREDEAICGACPVVASPPLAGEAIRPPHVAGTYPLVLQLLASLVYTHKVASVAQW